MDLSGSAAAPRVSSGLSQSSDFRLPVCRRALPCCNSARAPWTWVGGRPRGLKIRASVEARVPPTRARRPVWRSRLSFSRFAILEPRG